MIYQPRNVQPTYKSIDGTQNNEISMIMNTTNYVNAYKLTIYDMSNNIFYNGSKTNFSSNLYNGDTGYIDLPSSLHLVNGTDYKWVARLYQPSADMLITYGNVLTPTTYTYTVGSGGLAVGNYSFYVEGKTYVISVMMSLVNTDVISFDTTNKMASLISTASSSSYYLGTTEVDSDIFAQLPLTQSGTTYTYTVGDQLFAGKYKISVGGINYYFTTLADLDKGDKITFTSNDGLIKQTHYENDTNIVITLAYISAKPLTPVPSVNTSTNVYIQRNINIKDGMSLQIGNQTRTISTYNVNNGLAIVSPAFSGVPADGAEYNVYSDFIEMMPENMLYVRATPTLTINNSATTITTKSVNFTGTYTQTNGVPLVYYVWNLYSIDGEDAVLIKTSKKVYSANIKFSYDGFKNGETYSLVLVCENEFGIVSQTEKSFRVSYEQITYDQEPKAVQTKEQGIKVTWLTTITTEPYSISTRNSSGYIQPGNNTRSSLWLETGQQIPIGVTIKVGLSETEGVVSNYNANTGYTTLSEPLGYAPSEGEYYYVYSEPNYNLNGINILMNTPYNGVNSASIGDNHLIYEKETGLALWEDDYWITLQFLLNDDFFFGDNDVYQEIALIARYQGDSSNGMEDILLFARGYSFYAITPYGDEIGKYNGTVTAVGSNGEYVDVSFPYDINTNKHKFINFIDKEYTTYIQSCIETGTDTYRFNFQISIPEENRPSVGDEFFLYNTVSAPYYNTPNNVFLLQSTNFISPYSDYIWDDNGSWQDSYYWVEGGTPIERAANTWWKVQFTKDEMVVSRGGV